jgi:hypothetical protein
MTVITFDKLAYVDRLTAAGISEKDARAHADSLDIALREQVATKADLDGVKTELEVKLGELKAELTSGFRLHNWMIGINLTVSLLIFGKLVFIH